MDYVNGISGGKSVGETRPIADKLIEVAPADALGQLALFMMTRVEDANRDYPTALKMAGKANTMKEGKDAIYLDTYAMALFKNNRIAEAVAAETKAVELSADNPKRQDDYKTRLEQYKAGIVK
jgi:hypothetical protein